VPKSSGSCQKLCNLLLLVALLSLRLGALRHEEPESLIKLAGVPRRRRPSRADAAPAVAFLSETLAQIPKKDRPTNQMDLFFSALEELNSREIPVRRRQVVPPLEIEVGLQRRLDRAGVPRAGPADFSQFGIVVTPTPGFGGGAGGDLPVPTPGIRSSFDRTTGPLVCRVVARTLLPGAIDGPSSPLQLSAAIASALGCGVGISRGV